MKANRNHVQIIYNLLCFHFIFAFLNHRLCIDRNSTRIRCRKPRYLLKAIAQKLHFPAATRQIPIPHIVETWKPVPRGAIQQGSEHFANAIKSGLVPDDSGIYIGNLGFVI